ncbi:reverse transcriptase N-terminal domain-containing protein [Gloeocapsa sp. PCC 73106]
MLFKRILVRRLQRLLTTSYEGKLWAIREVTQDNQGNFSNCCTSL